MATWETNDAAWGAGEGPAFADSNGFDDHDSGNPGDGFAAADGAGHQEPNGACHRCNEEGHYARECPNAPAMTCRECDSPDHVVKDCPERSCKNCGEKGKTYVPPVLLDTI